MPFYTDPDLVHNDNDFNLRDMKVIEALWKMEESHFWHKARQRFILQFLRKHRVQAGSSILEVGCGSGAVSGFLANQGFCVSGVDTAGVLIQKASQRYPKVMFYNSDIQKLPKELNGSFDVICFFDVLEHLDFPETLIDNALRFAAPNALIVATVPADQSLFSMIDVASGHKRRYVKSSLESLFLRCGLGSIKSEYFFKFIYPILRFHRKRNVGPDYVLSDEDRRSLILRDAKVPFTFLNLALQNFCKLETYFGHLIPTKGASLIAVGSVK